jgi:hypothetical protein
MAVESCPATRPTTLAMHIHPHLSIKVDGRPVTIPANIGIDPRLYNDHSLDCFMPDMGGPIAATHTHDASGILHIEAGVQRDFKLGDFLNVWGVDLAGVNVGARLNGEAFQGDARDIPLSDGARIELELSRG